MRWFLATFMLLTAVSMQAAEPAVTRIFEKTFESGTAYTDAFNVVDVDVIFTKDSETWRVPTFWRGGNKWTVRFAPPSPGTFTYRLEATDKNNPDLNGHEGQVTISAYTGENALLRRGPPKVSANKRYFEYADGSPFYWLGDTWWSGMSTRLSWEGFQKLTADRKAKGYTVIQFVAGLVSRESGPSPLTASACNEGGCVWEPEFKRINPGYFDSMDRRVQLLIDAGIVPAITGGWTDKVALLGVAKMKKQWRNLIARYGAYPVFWILGGEVYDPPPDLLAKVGNMPGMPVLPGGWTELARYVRATDPYHHPLTAHELPPPYDNPLQDESLTDFDMFQPCHFGWPSIAIEVAQLDMHYARTTITKPLVVGEIGYEKLGGTHLEDFQRVAFWLAMLNGAAGHTYGAVGVWHSYDVEKVFHARKWSFFTWEDGMDLPGGYQIGLGAKLLQKYPWWRMEPHPEWVTPRGTTLLEPRTQTNGFDFGTLSWHAFFSDDYAQPLDDLLPQGEWKNRHGTFRLPYAAGIPGEVRFIYMPCFGLNCRNSATVLGLENGVRYHAYFWEPDSGVMVDMGAIEKGQPGEVIRQEKFGDSGISNWTEHGAKTTVDEGKLRASGDTLTILNQVSETDYVAGVDGRSDAGAALVLRYHDPDNYLAAVYSAKDKAIYLTDRNKGVDGERLENTPIPAIGADIRLTAEVRGEFAAVSISDGQRSYTSAIARVTNTLAGSSGLKHEGEDQQFFADFELRKSPTLVKDDHLERKLYDAKGIYKGEMKGHGLPAQRGLGDSDWDSYGREKDILLDAWRPSRLPTAQDWLLVLQHQDQ
jgi:Protein of unknown function (DUF4038)/Domain of unknown function (DUF5060)